MEPIKNKIQTNSKSKDSKNDDKNSFESALKHAFRLLGYKDRSEKEMQEKLIKKGFSADIVDNVIIYLKDRDFINDKRFAGILKRDVIERKHLDRHSTRAYLINKGVSSDIADEVLDDEDNYLDIAKDFIEKKLRNLKAYDEEIIKKRLWGMLARRGFSYETINKALKSLDLKEE